MQDKKYKVTLKKTDPKTKYKVIVKKPEPKRRPNLRRTA